MKNEEIIKTALIYLKVTVEKIKSIYTDKDLSAEERHIKVMVELRYFEGVADVLKLITGKDYQWYTTDGVNFRVISIHKDTEVTLFHI